MREESHFRHSWPPAEVGLVRRGSTGDDKLEIRYDNVFTVVGQPAGRRLRRFNQT